MSTQCFNTRPIHLKEPILQDDGTWLLGVNAPCGKCENCIKRRRMEWCFRMEEELKVSKCAYFVTLTYDPDNLKWDKYGNMILVKKDLVNFFKRLRINSERYNGVTREMLYNNLDVKKDKVRFYACGEYGEQFLRPHYHAIIYNASQRLIKDSWSFGIVHIGNANSESIGYVTKYLDKWRNKNQDWKKPKEFNIQSKGIGKNFVKRMGFFYKNNLDINFMVNRKGVRIPLSRYYNLMILDKEEMKKKTAIINKAVNDERNKKVAKLGMEEYISRRLSNQKYIRKVFRANARKRGM